MKRKVRNRRIAVFAAFIVLALVLLPGTQLHARGTHEEAPSYKYYTDILICRGDTLTSIADRYYSREFRSRAAYIREVKFINHLSSDRIDAGDYLIVPYYSHELK